MGKILEGLTSVVCARRVASAFTSCGEPVGLIMSWRRTREQNATQTHARSQEWPQCSIDDDDDDGGAHRCHHQTPSEQGREVMASGRKDQANRRWRHRLLGHDIP